MGLNNKACIEIQLVDNEVYKTARRVKNEPNRPGVVKIKIKASIVIRIAPFSNAASPKISTSIIVWVYNMQSKGNI
jgi:hypothetical protein